MAEKDLRAELRRKSTIELHRLVTAPETPEATRNMAQEILWERGKIQELSKAECQERVERIFREIEEGNVLRISTLGDWWQALKKQEGVGK